jgi:hypothetical protein
VSPKPLSGFFRRRHRTDRSRRLPAPTEGGAVDPQHHSVTNTSSPVMSVRSNDLGPGEALRIIDGRAKVTASRDHVETYDLAGAEPTSQQLRPALPVRSLRAWAESACRHHRF